MTGPLALNRYNLQKWVTVASAATWKRWEVNPFGTLEAEALRGPLIIWAKMTPGEVGDGLRLEAPKPSPLDLRVSALNTAAHFERFSRAACGQVRPSIKWRTPRRLQTRLVAAHFLAVMFNLRFEDIKNVLFMYPTIHNIDGEERLKKSASTRRFRARLRERKRRFSDFTRRSDVSQMSVSEELWPDLNELIAEARNERLPERRLLERLIGGLAHGISGFGTSPLAIVSFVKRYVLFDRPEPKTFLRALWQLLREVSSVSKLALREFLRECQLAGYLAYVRRRVKPVPRRDRVPRPVYARPRPPSAPLAPPVTC